jgi:oligosaccharide repeat unit polymerase
MKNSRSIFLLVFYILSILTCRSLFGGAIATIVFLTAFFWFGGKTQEEFDANDLFWIIYVIFFGVAPAQSLDDGFFYMSGATNGMYYSDGDVLNAIFIVLLFYTLFFCGCRFLELIKKNMTSVESNVNIKLSGVVFLFIVSVVCFGVYIGLSGGVGFVTRSRLEQDIEGGSVFGAIFLAGLAISTAMLGSSAKKHGGILRWGVFFCSAIELMLCVNIYNSPRFFIAGAWLPVFLSIFSKKIKFIHVAGLIVFSIFIAMPILSITTRHGVYEEVDTEVVTDNFFKIKDVDIFETGVHTISYVRDNGLSLGSNIAAIGLFFIPRNFWPTKPYVGGLLIGRELFGLKAASTDNLSYFIAFDFYQDFGYIGVLVGGFVLGGVFWILLKYNVTICEKKIFNYALIGILPIIVRGPVGAVIGFPICLLAAAWVLPITIEFLSKEKKS